VGELEVTTLSPATTVAKKAKIAIINSIDFIARIAHWPYFRQEVAALSWVAGVATVTPYQRVYEVVDTLTKYVLRSIHPVTIRDLTSEAAAVGIPIYYSIVGDNQVMLYPEPTALIKPEIRFRILVEPTMPTVDADVIALSPPLYQLAALYAQIRMHVAHTGDISTAEALSREFEMRVQHLRSQDVLQNTFNMSGS